MPIENSEQQSDDIDTKTPKNDYEPIVDWPGTVSLEQQQPPNWCG